MDIFECAVCLQQLNDPRVISCGHTFCKGCLQKLKPNQLLCPLCRRTFESVDSLPSNFVILKWMDENKNQNIEKKDIICDNCEDKLAVVWCEYCTPGFYYCTNCDSTLHAKVLRNHLRLSLKEKSKKAPFTKCKNHMRDNEVYCIDCKSLICTICVIDYHQQHKVQSVSKCAEEKRVELKSCVTPFQNLKPIVKKEQELMVDKEKNVKELKSIETRAQVLKNLIIQNDKDLQQITIQKEKIKTSEIVLINSIQEMRDIDLLDNKNIEIMKRKIQDVLNEVYPEGDKERLEKERLEKERLVVANRENQQEIPNTPQHQNIQIARTSHTQHAEHYATNLLIDDNSSWASLIEIAQTSITFDLGSKCKVSSFCIKHRGDSQIPERLSLQFGDSIDGPWSSPTQIETQKITSLQTFNVNGFGRYCFVSFLSSPTKVKGLCPYVVRYISFK